MNIFKRKKNGSKDAKRKARFAGTWYEDDENKLASQMVKFFSDAEERLSVSPVDHSFKNNPMPESNLLALIVPHAGYAFSGSTAAFAYEFARLKREPKRIFLLGPSHYVGFQGVALSKYKSFETPLGDLDVDSQCVSDLTSYPLFGINDEVHRKEHSLELQLAFIKHSFSNVKIVPIVVGMLKNESDLVMVGQVLKRHLGPDDLIVVSSDFTHFGPRYDYVPFDSCDPDKVKELDENAFQYIRDCDLHGFVDFHDRTGCTICGFYPCSLLLSILPDGSQATLLKYGTSRDSYADDPENSVSYLSLVLTDTNEKQGWEQSPVVASDDLLNEKEKADLLKLARSCVESYVTEKRVPSIKEFDVQYSEVLKKPFGVFVTLFKKKAAPDTEIESDNPRADKDLRGCIGYIFPIKPLAEAVIDNAVGACSKDWRFSPVEQHELSSLQFEISVLTPLSRVESVDDIEIGVHGVVLYHGDNQAVFLPHVATEFGWSKVETLEQLSSKAGLNKNAWKDPQTQFDIFESIMFEED